MVIESASTSCSNCFLVLSRRPTCGTKSLPSLNIGVFSLSFEIKHNHNCSTGAIVILASRQLILRLATSTSKRLLSTAAINMAPKQATLGYVKSSQATIGWVKNFFYSPPFQFHFRFLDRISRTAYYICSPVSRDAGMLTSILASSSDSPMVQSPPQPSKLNSPSLPSRRRSQKMSRNLRQRKPRRRKLLGMVGLAHQVRFFFHWPLHPVLPLEEST